jgi:hypothetical protein
MPTHFTETELSEWCVCGRAHQSFCCAAPCYWGLTWPHPEMPLQSMEDSPWMTEIQAERHARYQDQRSKGSGAMKAIAAAVLCAFLLLAASPAGATVASSFAPTAGAFLAVTATSANVALPTTGTPTVAIVTNIGQVPVFLALGASGVVAPAMTGVALMPGAQIVLTIGSATNLAAITLAGASGINIAVGL